MAAITGGGTITASLNVLTVIEVLTAENVIATSKGGVQDTTLLLGAHSDSVAAGPGISKFLCMKDMRDRQLTSYFHK